MKNIFTLIFCLIFSFSLQAQDAIKNVIVETYYVSDADDATDTTGGHLPVGSKTYRVYIKMKPGCLLTKVYGDARHTLKIQSSSNFFNNIDRGKSFGKDIRKIDFKKNTVALDTWITLGQTSTKVSNTTFFGLLKSSDSDGSLIGGTISDGGSALIPGGILKNNNYQAGLPLTSADGMDTMINIPTGWQNFGFLNLISGEDSTIFGSLKAGSEFISKNAFLQNDGIRGVMSNDNHVLVGQFTTTGNLTFSLNVEIKNEDGSVTKYVAEGNDTLNEKFSPYLTFPMICGCRDSNYLEYKNIYACSSPDSCKTKIVFGCMDQSACNYNSNANYNIQSLCCYPGLCGDRDISLACPSLGNQQVVMKSFPNPAKNIITIEASSINNQDIKYMIYNSFGRVIIEKNIGNVFGTFSDNIDLLNFTPGIYLIYLYAGDSIVKEMFIKN